MNEMKEIRKRIAQRRGTEEDHQPFIFRLIYRGLMCVMAVGVLALAYLINDKIGLVKLPESLSMASVSEWLPFDHWFSFAPKEESVAALPTYTLLKQNQYANGTNQANLILDGVVLHVEEKDPAKNSITVRHDNGVVVTYGHLNQISVKANERLKKGTVIGTFDEYVTLDMVKDNQRIDLQSALTP